MRRTLKQLGDAKRYTFQGTFKGVGFKTSFHGQLENCYLPTLLLGPLYCEGKIVTDHLWCNYTRQFSRLGMLKQGDVVQFNARVTRYVKGHTGHKKVDYGIERPTRVSLLNGVSRAILPDALKDKNALIGYVMLTNRAYYLANGRPYEAWYVTQFRAWQQMKNNKIL